MAQQPTENVPPERTADDSQVDRALDELTELLRRGRRMRMELAARLDGAQLSRSQLPGSQLPRSQLPGSQLSGSQLSGSQLSGSQLSETQLLAMWFCGRWASDLPESGVPQHELAEAIALSAAQTSHLLEQLRTHGWLAAFRPPRDRRRQLWRLTPDGARQLHGALARLDDWAAAWMEPPPATPTSATPAAPRLRVFVGDEQEGPRDAQANPESGDAPC